MEIKTNNHWYPIIYGYELTEKERAQFDYLDSEELVSGSFVRYKNRCYHIAEFLRVDIWELREWDGYIPNSFFSGVVIKLSDGGDACKLGTY